MSRHSRHVITALQSRNLIQHPPVRSDALALSNLSNLAIGIQHLEHARQIKCLCGARHLLGKASLEVGTLRVNEVFPASVNRSLTA